MAYGALTVVRARKRLPAAFFLSCHRSGMLAFMPEPRLLGSSHTPFEIHRPPTSTWLACMRSFGSPDCRIPIAHAIAEAEEAARENVEGPLRCDSCQTTKGVLARS